MRTWWNSVAELVRPQRRPDLSVPSLDGRWAPNEVLDRAVALARLPGLRDLGVRSNGELVAAAGSALHLIDHHGAVRDVLSLPGEITTISAGPAGESEILVACPDVGMLAVDVDRRRHRDLGLDIDGRASITSITRGAAGEVWILTGSQVHHAEDWQRDLLTQGRTGSVWRLEQVDAPPERLATGLAWPAGLAVVDDHCVVSEPGCHRLIAVHRDGSVDSLAEDLPAYPGAVEHDGDGLVVSCFAPRSMLTEFITHEPQFLHAMLQIPDRRAWAAPALRTERHPREQVQAGQLMVFGQVKPWAPSRSYGLAARFDAQVMIDRTWHSRAHGSRHGIVRTVRHGDSYLAACAATGEILQWKDTEAHA